MSESESLGDTIDRLHHKVVIRDRRIAELEAELKALREAVRTLHLLAPTANALLKLLEDT